MTPEIQKIRNALRASAWVAWQCKDGKDADDYFQTLSVAQSFLQSNGFNHQNLLQHYRSARNRTVGGGIQFTKMLKSNEAFYQAQDGITSGAAMKVLPLAVFYRHNFEELINNIFKLTQILHNSPEAKLSAGLVGSHFWLILQENMAYTPENLLKLWQKIPQENIAVERFQFFDNIVQKAYELTLDTPKPLKLLKKLVWEIGITHLSWSTPVSACFWAFTAPELSQMLLEPKHYPFKRKITILNQEQKNNYKQHLIKIEEHTQYFNRYGERWQEDTVDADIDTFWSIAFSLIAAQNGLGQLKEEAKIAEKFWDDDLSSLAEAMFFFNQMP